MIVIVVVVVVVVVVGLYEDWSFFLLFCYEHNKLEILSVQQ